eukprot:3761757-Rhodomonas_salina.1
MASQRSLVGLVVDVGPQTGQEPRLGKVCWASWGWNGRVCGWASGWGGLHPSQHAAHVHYTVDKET